VSPLQQLQALIAWAQLRARTAARVTARRRKCGDEAGVSIVEWVIIVAVVAGLAIAVGAIIVSKVTAKANGINLGS
jgi:Flp pilus assembly pilin Flp